MRVKLVALGNVLMGDDGIAIHLANGMEDRLRDMGIEVIYAETDIGYCISQLQEEDYLILVDACMLGIDPGKITSIPLQELTAAESRLTQHGISFLHLLKLYFPAARGIVLGVEISGLSFCYGLSPEMESRLADISRNMLELIQNVTHRMESYNMGKAGADLG